ncbi:MAG: phosphopantothenoylcysteine decarboxylase [Deltaproteobacteria bacterium]|nr:phosphopantothenoylcysteine decarboxylase [Deltaproteobacteria bacterium]
MPNLLLGVTGGIAAYKAADLCSRAMKAGYTVRVVMTEAATRFVAPLTFEGLVGHQVMVNVLDPGHGSEGLSAVEHVEWAKWADIACVAPLTASTLGKLACGIADNALTTLWLALPPDRPSLLAPAMNTEMWLQPVVQRNLRWLEALERHTLIPPVSKRLACGDVGVGGLAEVEDILAAIVRATP